MSFTPLEKRTLQRTVQEKIEGLEGSSLNPREKRQLQTALDEALSKLLGEGQAEKQKTGKLDDLIAGKFNHLSPQEFLRILEEVVQEVGGDIEPIKPPAVNYIEANQNMILESALFTGWKS